MTTRIAAIWATLAALLALGIALGSERWGGLVPCALCLVERWPYRIAIVLGVVAILLPRRPARFVLALLALTMLVGAGLGGLHVGVEQGLWPSPLPECAAPHITGTTIAQRLASMPARPSLSCEDATYLIPGLPVSMAAMDLIWALAISVSVATFLARSKGSAR